MSGKSSLSIVSSLGSLRAIKQGRTPVHPDIQTHGSTDVQPPARAEGQTPDARTPGRTEARAPARTDLPLQNTGKRSHPDFRKRTILIRDSTWMAASRKWQDSGNFDFSELVEKLLREYVSGR